MKRILLAIVVAIPIFVCAQQSDTIQAKKIVHLEQQLDSLRRTIKAMDKEMQNVKQSMVEGRTNIDEVLAIFSGSDVESTSFETRSRYKRIDDLLKAIEQRPGQLMLNGNVTSISQVAMLNRKNESFGTGSFDIFATTSFGKGTLLFVDLEAIGGDGPDQYFTTISGLNGDAGSTQSIDSIDRLNVLEAWVEFSLSENLFTLTIGKIDLTNYFDNNASANDETLQFISGSFINSSSFIVPSNSPGFRLRTTLFNKYHIQFGMASQDNAGLGLFRDLYKIASLGWTFAPGTGFEANIRSFAYQIPIANNDYGYGVSIDKVFLDKYNVFGRYGFNQDNVARFGGVQSSFSFGFRYVESIRNQPLVIGLAYGVNMPYHKNLNEMLTELYLRRQLNKWVHLSPHFQYVWNRNGISNDVFVMGLRTHFNF